MIGIVFTTSGFGGILSQAPLKALLSVIQWETVFYSIGGICCVFSITCFFFVRGDPTSRGHPAVNEDLQPSVALTPLREKLRLLFGNLKRVESNRNFWIISLWSMCFHMQFFVTAGLLIVQYLLYVGMNNAVTITLGMSI
jgi:sugar phosphate permease